MISLLFLLIASATSAQDSTSIQLNIQPQQCVQDTVVNGSVGEKQVNPQSCVGTVSQNQGIQPSEASESKMTWHNSPLEEGRVVGYTVSVAMVIGLMALLVHLFTGFNVFMWVWLVFTDMLRRPINMMTKLWPW